MLSGHITNQQKESTAVFHVLVNLFKIYNCWNINLLCDRCGHL